ncbi:Ferritin, partial [Cynara cardunculus var. scolymus]
YATSRPRATQLCQILSVHVSPHPAAHHSHSLLIYAFIHLLLPIASHTHFISFPLFFYSYFLEIMLLRTPPTLSFLRGATVDDNSGRSMFSPSSVSKPSAIVCAAAKGGSSNHRPIAGVVFEPFEEVKKELNLVPSVPQQSIARQKYADESEASINEQINVEYNVSYVYHAMYAYFDRDNVALKGLAKFFKEASEEEREHAEIFMEYQNKRGGKVKLQSILMPLSEFDHEEKGDALYATRNHDVQLTDFVESGFLGEQVEAIKKISEYVAQLRRVGKGHGVWHFDQMLLR